MSRTTREHSYRGWGYALVTQSLVQSKKQPESQHNTETKMNLESSTTIAGKMETTTTKLSHPGQLFATLLDSPHQQQIS